MILNDFIAVYFYENWTSLHFFQTKWTPCINNIIELAATYCKRNLKTALKHVTIRLMSSWQRLRVSRMGPESGPMDPRAWAPLHLRISDPSKNTSIFRTMTTVSFSKKNRNKLWLIILQVISVFPVWKRVVDPISAQFLVQHIFGYIMKYPQDNLTVMVTTCSI